MDKIKFVDVIVSQRLRRTLLLWEILPSKNKNRCSGTIRVLTVKRIYDVSKKKISLYVRYFSEHNVALTFFSPPTTLFSKFYIFFTKLLVSDA